MANSVAKQIIVGVIIMANIVAKQIIVGVHYNG